MVMIIILILVMIKSLYPQDTSKSFYFPHNTGDMWEYFYWDGPSYTDTIQNQIVSNYTDPDGIIHITQNARTINPIGPPKILYDVSKYWLDTVNNFVYGRQFEIGYDSLLVYKLTAQKGDQWILISGGNFGMARICNKWEGNLFGNETTFMRVHYYVTSDSTDTTGADFGYDTIADGFGLVFRGGGDFPGEINLIGAVINGIVYGDTTLVTIKEEDYFYPSTIKLKQNYPNPFNPTTNISFELAKRTTISLIVYDLIGNEVKIIINNKEFEAGKYNMLWDGKSNSGDQVCSGVYIYSLLSNNLVSNKKMMVLK